MFPLGNSITAPVIDMKLQYKKAEKYKVVSITDNSDLRVIHNVNASSMPPLSCHQRKYGGPE